MSKEKTFHLHVIVATTTRYPNEVLNTTDIYDHYIVVFRTHAPSTKSSTLLPGDGLNQLRMPLLSSALDVVFDHHVDLAGFHLELCGLEDSNCCLAVWPDEPGGDVEVQDFETKHGLGEVAELAGTGRVRKELGGVGKEPFDRQAAVVGLRRIGSFEVVLKDQVDADVSQVAADSHGREKSRPNVDVVVHADLAGGRRSQMWDYEFELVCLVKGHDRKVVESP